MSGDMGQELFQAYRDYEDARAGMDAMADQLQAKEERAYRAEAALTRVRSLHTRYRDSCAHCSQLTGRYVQLTGRYVPWPCPTIRALDGEEANHA